MSEFLKGGLQNVSDQRVTSPASTAFFAGGPARAEAHDDERGVKSLFLTIPARQVRRTPCRMGRKSSLLGTYGLARKIGEIGTKGAML
jgi:hypothetical protein